MSNCYLFDEFKAIIISTFQGNIVYKSLKKNLTNRESPLFYLPLIQEGLNFGSGKYDFEFGENSGEPKMGYGLKFEAEGYTTVISRLITTDEGEVRIDVVLRATPVSIITVLWPNGQPAAGVEIGLSMPGVRLQLLRDGTFGPWQRDGSLLKTDAKGQLNLPPDDSIRQIIAVHPKGFAEVTPQELRLQSTLQLKPWGQVDGIHLKGGKPSVGGQLTLNYMGADPFLDLSSLQTAADQKGRFTFPKVPPGQFKLVGFIRISEEPGTKQWGNVTLKENVEVLSGQTTTLEVLRE